ncbi:MAG: hypothetical protein Q9209_001630 [Squamulea sp. 1 TL-2023]
MSTTSPSTSQDQHPEALNQLAATGPLAAFQTCFSQTHNPPPAPSLALTAIQNSQDAILQFLLSTTNIIITRTLATAAVKTGSISLLDILLTAGMDINIDLGYMGTPLLYATQLCHPVTYLASLFSRGADPARGSMGGGVWSGLAVAATCGDEEVVRLFLKHGAVIEGSGALREAAARGKLGVVKVLVEEGGAPVDGVGGAEGNGRTALQAATSEGEREVVSFLVEKGADIRVKDEQGRTPMEIAVEEGRADIVAILAKAEKDGAVTR